MTRRAPLLAFLLALPLHAAESPRVLVDEIEIPGNPIATVVSPDGAKALVMVDPDPLEESAARLCPEKRRRELYEVGASGRASLVPLTVPAGAHALYFDPRETGADGSRWFIADDDALWELSFTPGAAPRLRSSIDFDPLHGSSTRPVVVDGHPFVGLDTLDGFTFFEPSEGASYRVTKTVALENEIQYFNEQFLVSRPPMRFIGSSGEVAILAGAVDIVDEQRLRLTRMDVAPSSVADAKAVECWTRLPGPEAPLERRLLMIDDEPALVVLSTPTDKASLFGEKLLRSFRLKLDGTRMGHGPFAAFPTRINLWQTTGIDVEDVDGDGADDLTLTYWKGLSTSKLVVDVYRGDGDGGFLDQPATTAIEIKKGRTDQMPTRVDADGDGRADLVVATETGLSVYYANPKAKHGKSRWSPKPVTRIPIDREEVDTGQTTVSVGSAGVRAESGTARRRRVVDLDGDGRDELLERTSPLGPLRWIRFATPDSSRNREPADARGGAGRTAS